MTFIYDLDPYALKLYPKITVFDSYRITYMHTYRQTDIQTHIQTDRQMSPKNNYHATLQVVNMTR